MQSHRPGQQVASAPLISPLGLQVHDAHHDDLLAWPHSSPDASAERHCLRNAKPHGGGINVTHKPRRNQEANNEKNPGRACVALRTSRRDRSSLSGEMRPGFPSESFRCSSSTSFNTSGVKRHRVQSVNSSSGKTSRPPPAP